MKQSDRLKKLKERIADAAIRRHTILTKAWAAETTAAVFGKLTKDIEKSNNELDTLCRLYNEVLDE